METESEVGEKWKFLGPKDWQEMNNCQIDSSIQIKANKLRDKPFIKQMFQNVNKS